MFGAPGTLLLCPLFATQQLRRVFYTKAFLGFLRWVWLPEISQHFFKYGNTHGSSTLEIVELLKQVGPLDTQFLTPM